MTGLREAIRADHDALIASQERYGDHASGGSLCAALVTNVGLQQLAVFRLAVWCADRSLRPVAMVLCRMIRHLYGAEMHWAAEIAPGVVIVHGNGLVVSRSARVGAGCVLSHNVTLGVSRGADGAAGAPTLGSRVHVGPGAVLVGPITIGADSKIGPNTYVASDVDTSAIVTAGPGVVTRRRGERAAAGE